MKSYNTNQEATEFFVQAMYSLYVKEELGLADFLIKIALLSTYTAEINRRDMLKKMN